MIYCFSFVLLQYFYLNQRIKSVHVLVEIGDEFFRLKKEKRIEERIVSEEQIIFQQQIQLKSI